jgi:hypothetical protein
MFIKNGDAEIVDVIDPSEIEDDELKKLALSDALKRAKDRISVNSSVQKKMEN